jgi:hypothetical protein
VIMWAGFMWFWFGCGLMWTRLWTFRFHKFYFVVHLTMIAVGLHGRWGFHESWGTSVAERHSFSRSTLLHVINLITMDLFRMSTEYCVVHLHSTEWTSHNYFFIRCATHYPEDGVNTFPPKLRLNIYQTVPRNIPRDCNLIFCRPLTSDASP